MGVYLSGSFAAPRHTPRRATGSEGSASLLPPRRRDGLLSVASLRRAFFASPVPQQRTASAGDACSLADQERIRAALGRTVAAVQAAYHIGEGAPTTGARGNP